ncbi:TolC family protein [Sinomicrobium sp. M5D2P17]
MDTTLKLSDIEMKFSILSGIILFFSSTAFSQQILEDYIREGLESNLGNVKLQADYQRSLAVLQEARRMYGPQIDVIGNYNRNFQEGIAVEDQQGLGDLLEDSNSVTFEDGKLYYPPKNFYKGGIQLMQPVFVPELKHNKAMYTAQSEAARATLEDFKTELSASIAIAYYQYLESIAMEKVLEEGLKLAEKNLSSTEKLIALHKATKDALYRAKSNVEDVKKQIRNAQNTVQNSKYYFNFLLNRDAHALIAIDEKLQFDASARYQVLKTEDTLSAYKLENIKKNQEALEAQARLIRSNHLPDVNLQAFGGIQGVELDFDNDRLKMAQVQLSLKWNIFNSGTNKAKYRQNQEQQESLQAQYQMKQQELQMKELQNFGDIMTHLENYVSVKSTYENARIYYETVYEKYLLGSASILELTDAQSQLLKAHQDQIDWYYQLHMDQAAYLKETGKTLSIVPYDESKK